MVTPGKLRMDVAKLDALLEAFEHTYLRFLDLGEGDIDERDRGSLAFYAIRDLAQKIIRDSDELIGHMEVCDAVLAAKSTVRKGNVK